MYVNTERVGSSAATAATSTGANLHLLLRRIKILYSTIIIPKPIYSKEL